MSCCAGGTEQEECTVAPAAEAAGAQQSADAKAVRNARLSFMRAMQAALGKRRPPQHLQQKLRPGQHAYYWCCDNTQSGACGFWKWDDECSEQSVSAKQHKEDIQVF